MSKRRPFVYLALFAGGLLFVSAARLGAWEIVEEPKI
jgi:hypothetical protein